MDSASEHDPTLLAIQDQLTGLASPALLEDRLGLALRQRLRSGAAVGLLVCVVDGFQRVLDAHGPATGDHLLQAVAERLATNARGADTIGRLGADEFAIVCTDLADPSSLDHIAARLFVAVGQPADVSGVRLTPLLSIGSTVAQDGDTVEDVIRRADPRTLVGAD